MAWHARLSASNAYRWMPCPGSVREIEALEAKYGREPSNEYAALGTAAHAVGTHCLREGIESAWELEGWAVDRDDALHPPPFELMPWWHVVDGDMADAVDVYLGVVEEIRRTIPGDDEGIETQFTRLVELHLDFGGKGDYFKAEAFGLLHVVDYKHGAGVIVEVVDNAQLKKYAVGALLERPDCDRVKITIVQPRASHPHGPVRTVEYTRQELDDFTAELVAAARRTEDPDAPLHAGDHCRFCRALPECPEARRAVMEQAVADFDEPAPERVEVDTDRLAATLPWVPVIEAWCSAVEALGQTALERGIEVEGFKLVRGKSYRAWLEKDETKLTRKLLALAKRLKLKVAKADLYSEPKLCSPNQAEKLGKGMKRAVAEMWDKPLSSKLAIAPVDDPRSAVVASVKEDFEEDV